MGYLQHSKRSDNEKRTVEVRWGIFFVRIWLIFLFLRAVVNIPVQTLIISSWLLFRKMIISQLELGPPVERTSLFFVYAIVVNVWSAGHKRKIMSGPFKCERQTSRIFGQTPYQMSSKDILCEQGHILGLRKAYDQYQQFWKCLMEAL